MMTWAKLDDQFPEHPRIIGLTDKAFRLHVAAICVAARRLTDGHLDQGTVRQIRALSGSRSRHVSELLEAGLWLTNGDGGYVIRDYLDYNPSAETVKNRRKAEAARVKRYRGGIT